MPLRLCLVAALLTLAPHTARAEAALAAISANFAETAEALLPLFHDATGHDLTLTTGSTGKLHAQIAAGAPFDLLLSADAETPAALMAEGHAVAGSAFTYATGQLALWSVDPDRIDAGGRAALTEPTLRFIAIANPDLAPYGVAARETLQHLGLWQRLQPNIVMGQNIGQTTSMVASGAAEVGFIALSAVQSPRATTKGSRWDVPDGHHAPIRQEAVLLAHGADNAAARAFLGFLRGPQATEVIARFGYGTGNDTERPE